MTDRIERVRLLTGHTSPETAYLVDDYPYGRVLRCSIRYWVETASKGAKKGHQRFVSQTTNPKKPGDPWNKPHGDTYDLMTFMYLNHEDHVKHLGVGNLAITPTEDARVRLMGIYEQLPDQRRAFYDALVAMSHKYAEPWERYEEIVSAMVVHIQTTGEDPVPDENGVWEWPGGRASTLWDLRVYVTEAHQRLSE